jgi:hypothetical protein
MGKEAIGTWQISCIMGYNDICSQESSFQNLYYIFSCNYSTGNSNRALQLITPILTIIVPVEEPNLKLQLTSQTSFGRCKNSIKRGFCVAVPALPREAETREAESISKIARLKPWFQVNRTWHCSPQLSFRRTADTKFCHESIQTRPLASLIGPRHQPPLYYPCMLHRF